MRLIAAESSASALIGEVLSFRLAADPWCSGPTCQPVTLEIAGSNPVGSAIFEYPDAPSAARTGRSLARVRMRGNDDSAATNSITDGGITLGRSGRHPRGRSVGSGRRRGGWGGPSVIWVAVVTIALASLATIAILLGSPKAGDARRRARPAPRRGSPAPRASRASRQTARARRRPSARPGRAPRPPATAPIGTVPIVPVVDFRSTLLSVTITDVRLDPQRPSAPRSPASSSSRPMPIRSWRRSASIGRTCPRG